MKTDDDGIAPFLWSWVTRMHDGRWVQVGAMFDAMHMPLTFVDEHTATSGTVRSIARQHAQDTGQPVRLVCYASPVVMEVFDPEKPS
jgi:hypothetical protein